MTALVLAAALVLVYALGRVTRRRPLTMTRAWLRAHWTDEESHGE
jgi:hypothetical protein